ncbi:MAG: tRNA (guanine-N7-)-methyltransferase [Parasphingorhabdus sp.]
MNSDEHKTPTTNTIALLYRQANPVTDSPTTPNLRPIRSFVRREGRITPGQERSLSEYWPKFGINHPGTVLDSQQVFGNSQPVELEIGCGDGAAMTEMAVLRPEHNFIGIEVYRPGVGNLLNALSRNQSSNVRVFDADAVEIISSRIADDSLQRIMVFFPDPWPKKKHHKRRLLQLDFIQLLTQKLKVGGELHIATDWQDYAEVVAETLASVPMLKSLAEDSIYSPRPETRPLTKYERRGQRLGHGVWDIIMLKQ